MLYKCGDRASYKIIGFMYKIWMSLPRHWFYYTLILLFLSANRIGTTRDGNILYVLRSKLAAPRPEKVEEFWKYDAASGGKG